MDKLILQLYHFGRGRRTQEAIREYFKDVMDRLYLHSNGAKMYKCYALQDGTLDFSNNRCERQIRRLAKYRNNSFFTGSPQAAKRLARLLSHFANCKDHHLDSFTYLCDVFRRINKTAKEELVNLLEHKWQPMPAMALA